jgi:hypothetical protein
MTDTEVVAREPDRPPAGKPPLVDAVTADELLAKAQAEGAGLLGLDGLLWQVTKAVLERALGPGAIRSHATADLLSAILEWSRAPATPATLRTVSRRSRRRARRSSRSRAGSSASLPPPSSPAAASSTHSSASLARQVGAGEI